MESRLFGALSHGVERDKVEIKCTNQTCARLSLWAGRNNNNGNNNNNKKQQQKASPTKNNLAVIQWKVINRQWRIRIITILIK